MRATLSLSWVVQRILLSPKAWRTRMARRSHCAQFSVKTFNIGIFLSASDMQQNKHPLREEMQADPADVPKSSLQNGYDYSKRLISVTIFKHISFSVANGKSRILANRIPCFPLPVKHCFNKILNLDLNTTVSSWITTLQASLVFQKKCSRILSYSQSANKLSGFVLTDYSIICTVHHLLNHSSTYVMEYGVGFAKTKNTMNATNQHTS